MDGDRTADSGIDRLDELIAADPRAASWTFAEHERGALHEAERPSHAQTRPPSQPLTRPDRPT